MLLSVLGVLVVVVQADNAIGRQSSRGLPYMVFESTCHYMPIICSKTLRQQLDPVQYCASSDGLWIP